MITISGFFYLQIFLSLMQAAKAKGGRNRLLGCRESSIGGFPQETVDRVLDVLLGLAGHPVGLPEVVCLLLLLPAGKPLDSNDRCGDVRIENSGCPTDQIAPGSPLEDPWCYHPGG